MRKKEGETVEEIKKSGLTFRQAKKLVDACIRDVKDGFVATGYYLWVIREERLWEEDGYNSFPEFLHCQYQKDKSWASRCIGLYEQFGKAIAPGELPVLAAPYRDYSVSQLIEMVSMTEEQREQVTPDMKIREIREMKPKRKKKAAAPPGEGVPTEVAAGEPEEQFPVQVEQAGSIEGSCDVATGEEPERTQRQPEEAEQIGVVPEPGKRQDTDREVPPEAKELDGNEKSGVCAYREEFPCSLTRDQQKTVGGNGNCHASCCWECPSRGGCNLECYSSASREKSIVEEEEPLSVQVVPQKTISSQTHPGGEEKEKNGEPVGDPAEEIKIYDRNLLKQMISEEEEMLGAMESYWKKDLPDCYTKKVMEIQAYKNLLAEHDAAEATEPGLVENPDPDQPELPVLKNNDQRKEWLKNYKSWGLWYRDEHIDVNYYKFDFDNGSRLVVAEYPQRENGWSSNGYDRVYYHLVEKGKKKYKSEKTYDDKYQDSATSETELVDYLKKIQKKGGKE